MSVPDFDYTQVNGWETDVKRLIGQAHDLMEVSPAKASLRLTSVVGILNDWYALIERLAAQERAEHPREHVPPVEVGSWGQQ